MKVRVELPLLIVRSGFPLSTMQLYPRSAFRLSHRSRLMG